MGHLRVPDVVSLETHKIASSNWDAKGIWVFGKPVKALVTSGMWEVGRWHFAACSFQAEGRKERFMLLGQCVSVWGEAFLSDDCSCS